jgi:hypothetical protein
MGPGGILYCPHGDSRWTSFSGAGSVGVEDLVWPARWTIGHGQGGASDRPYKGASLRLEISRGPM